MRAKQIYKITYPNGKIYIGIDYQKVDRLYVGSPSAYRQIALDIGLDLDQIDCRACAVKFPQYPLPRHSVVTDHGNGRSTIAMSHLDLTLHKEILWESQTVTMSELRALETKFIRETGANNPAIGYNRAPKYVPA